MPPLFNLYMDDSGTRHPDKKGIATEKHNRDWFSLGGILIRDEDELKARDMIAQFRGRWPVIGNEPFHSVDIRARSNGFRWLNSVDTDTLNLFFSDLDQLVINLPVHGIACVIDRPGYNARYTQRYGKNRWSLCKTAFVITVERAAKHAIRDKRKLRVYVEACNKKVDNRTKAYYNELKATGTPFDTTTSNAYDPLAADALRSVLYDFKTKGKSSPLMQFADMFLWPICMGGYHKSNRTYCHFLENGKLIDSICKEDAATMGIKYSCFENVDAKK